MNEVSRRSVPELACTIIAAGKELIAVFVETAVGEGKHVAFEFLDQCELLLFFVLYFFN